MLAPLAAGLGLFFAGVRFIATGLSPLVGRTLGRVLARAVRRPVLPALAGIAGGALTQSTTAVILIVVSLLRSRVITERRAILVPAWSHVGAAVLVILAAVDLRLVISYVLALTGFALYFDLDHGERRRHLVQVLLGFGLLFLGIDLMNGGTSGLEHGLIENGVLAQARANHWVMAGLGLALAVVTQSSTVAAAIGVAIARVDLLDLDAELLLLIGANLGSSLSYAMLGRRGAAEFRHVMLFQALQKAVGTVLLFVTAVLVVLPLGLDGLGAAVTRVLPGLPEQLAALFLLTQFLASLTCSLVFRRLDRVLLRIAPPAAAEALAVPTYLLPEAVATPSLALDLAGKEAGRLAQRLPLMLDPVRDGAPTVIADTAALRTAGTALGGAVGAYVAAILDADPARSEVGRAMRLADAAQNLVALHETLDEFVRTVVTARGAAPADDPASGPMVESLHLLMATLADAVAAGDAEELALATSLLDDRDRIMEEVRHRLLDSPDTAPAAQAALLRATACFERAVWLGRRCAVLAMPHTRAPTADAPQTAPT